MAKAVSALNLTALKITPHCMRHGGASVDALCGKLLPEIQRRGRWAAASSVKRYEKTGRLLKQLEKMSKTQIDASTEADLWLQRWFPSRLVRRGS